MIPIHNLLNRIRWDPRFREGKFEIGYYDRLLRRILVVPLAALRFSSAAPHVFELYDDGARCIASRFIACGASTATAASSGSASRRASDRRAAVRLTFTPVSETAASVRRR